MRKHKHDWHYISSRYNVKEGLVKTVKKCSGCGKTKVVKE